ncbi:cytochrome P450 4c21-like [Vespa velutina]|uniref:cytochrome P450 4c21-like n=1 Tax=Vespa velutina TaxID=202808 RepID=UPI001FB3E1A6|nr:cytochrome P450 4c21-like [Vespa velutina]
MLLTIIVIALLTVIFINILSMLYKFYVFRKTINKIPGDASFFGTVINFSRLSKEEYHKTFCEYTVRYKEGIYKLWIGYKPIVYIYKPEYVEVILRNTTNMKKPYTYDSFRPWLGDGLLTSTGSKWHQDRKLITPAFHFSMLDNFMIVMLEKSEILIDRIEKEIEKNIGKNAVNIYPLLADFTLDVICGKFTQMSFNRQYPSEIKL